MWACFSSAILELVTGLQWCLGRLWAGENGPLVCRCTNDFWISLADADVDAAPDADADELAPSGSAPANALCCLGLDPEG